MKNRKMTGISIQNKRPVNMDRFLLQERDLDGQQLTLAVVCDGVGSSRDGGFAAEECTRLFGEWFQGLTTLDCLGLSFLKEANIINIIVSDKIIQRSLDAATTMSAVLFTADQFFLVHAGDSRVYSWNGDAVSQLTVDHVTEDGKLDSFIGHRDRAVFQYEEGRIDCPVYFICSDGFYKRMDEAELISALRKLRSGNLNITEKRLIKMLVDRGEQDNISVAIIMNKNIR